MYFDTHSHLNFSAFKKDYKEVIDRSLKEKTHMIIAGSQQSTSERGVRIASEYDKGVWAAVGIHPLHLEKQMVKEENLSFETKGEEYDNKIYEELARHEKVKAIGETGLDYFRTKEKGAIKKQQEVFIKQLDLASILKLPAIVHCREAHDDTIKILGSFNGRIRAVLHCYTGNINEAEKYLEMGHCISFTGIITFTKAYNEVVKMIPLERIMAETDCPLLTPDPMRGKRNEPINVKYIVKKIAEIKKIDEKQVVETLYYNSINFFNVTE